MSAKHKLNSANLPGLLLFASLFASVTRSLTVFVIAFAALLFAAVHAGDIRR